MLVAKLWYLTYFAALSCLFPFLPVIFRQINLSEQQTGLILALRPWISLPAGSIWSGIADKWRLHRSILLITFVLGIIARLVVATCTTFFSVLIFMLISEAFSAPVTIIADAAVMAACAAEPSSGDYSQQRLYGAIGWGAFSLVAGAAMSRWGVNAGILLCSLLSAVALVPTVFLPLRALDQKLEAKRSASNSRPQSPSYNPCGGDDPGSFDDSLKEAELQPLRTASSNTHATNASGIDRVSGSGSSFIDIDDTPPGVGGDPRGGPTPASEGQINFWKAVWQLLSLPETLIFYSMATVLGFGVGNIEGFLFLYLQDLGGSETLMGLTLTFTCIAETVVLYYTGKMVNSLGVERCFHLIFAAFLIRMGSYATLAWWPSPWLVLPVEFLHGFTFGLSWGAGTVQCSRIAPPGLEATAQALFQGLYFGLGHGIGGLVGGTIYGRHGPQWMYLIACGVLILGWALTTAARRLVEHWDSKHQRYMPIHQSFPEL